MNEPKTIAREVHAIEAAQNELKLSKCYLITENPLPTTSIPELNNLKKIEIKAVPFYDWAAQPL